MRRAPPTTTTTSTATYHPRLHHASLRFPNHVDASKRSQTPPTTAQAPNAVVTPPDLPQAFNVARATNRSPEFSIYMEGNASNCVRWRLDSGQQVGPGKHENEPTRNGREHTIQSTEALKRTRTRERIRGETKREETKWRENENENE